MKHHVPGSTTDSQLTRRQIPLALLRPSPTSPIRELYIKGFKSALEKTRTTQLPEPQQRCRRHLPFCARAETSHPRQTLNSGLSTENYHLTHVQQNVSA